MDNFTLQKDTHNLSLSLITAKTVRLLSGGNKRQDLNTISKAKELIEDIINGREFIEGMSSEFTGSMMDNINIYSFFISNFKRIVEKEQDFGKLINDLQLCKSTLNLIINDEEVNESDIEVTKKLFLNLSNVLISEVRKIGQRHPSF